MSNLLFTEVSAEQQEIVAGGRRRDPIKFEKFTNYGVIIGKQTGLLNVAAKTINLN